MKVNDNGLSVTVSRRHYNGVRGIWDVRYWLENSGKFPALQFFEVPRTSSTGTPRWFEYSLMLQHDTGHTHVFQLDGHQRFLPSLCSALLSYSREEVHIKMAELDMCRNAGIMPYISGEYEQEGISSWYQALNHFKETRRTFVVGSWKELFTSPKYEFLLEGLPSSLHISDETWRYLDKKVLSAYVRKTYDVRNYGVLITGVEKHENQTK